MTTDAIIEEFIPPEISAGESELTRKNAMAYVHFVQRNEAAAAVYKQSENDNRNTLDAAFLDFITPPKILGIVIENFLKNQRKPIVALASDDFSVKSVSIKIYDSDNRLLDGGRGKQFLQKNKWYYFPELKPETYETLIVEAKAFDHPGNQSTFRRRVNPGEFKNEN